jgi:hypothetical protein
MSVREAGRSPVAVRRPLLDALEKCAGVRIETAGIGLGHQLTV